MNIDLRHDIWLYDKEYIVNYKFFDSFIFQLKIIGSLWYFTLPYGFMQEEVQWVAWKKFLTFEK